MSTTRNNIGLIIASITALTLISACSSENATPPDSAAATTDASTPDQPDASVDPNQALVEGIAATAQTGSAAVSMSIDSTSLDSAQGSSIGSGSLDFTSGSGEISWTSGEDSWTDLINAEGTFTFTEGVWFQAPVGSTTPTSANISPLDNLESLSNLTITSGTISGTAELTTSSGMNFSEEELVEISSTCPTDLDVTITLDDSGRITDIVREFTCPGFERTSALQLSDFGQPVTLSTPTDVFEVPGNQ